MPPPLDRRNYPFDDPYRKCGSSASGSNASEGISMFSLLIIYTFLKCLFYQHISINVFYLCRWGGDMDLHRISFKFEAAYGTKSFFIYVYNHKHNNCWEKYACL